MKDRNRQDGGLPVRRPSRLEHLDLLRIPGGTFAVNAALR
jgi:hypothetical protein